MTSLLSKQDLQAPGKFFFFLFFTSVFVMHYLRYKSNITCLRSCSVWAFTPITFAACRHNTNPSTKSKWRAKTISRCNSIIKFTACDTDPVVPVRHA